MPIVMAFGADSICYAKIIFNGYKVWASFEGWTFLKGKIDKKAPMKAFVKLLSFLISSVTPFEKCPWLSY